MKAIILFFFVISYTTFESKKQSENKTIFVTSERKMKKKQTIFKTRSPYLEKLFMCQTQYSRTF